MKNPLNRILERSSGVGHPNWWLISICKTCSVDKPRAFLAGLYSKIKGVNPNSRQS